MTLHKFEFLLFFACTPTDYFYEFIKNSVYVSEHHLIKSVTFSAAKGFKILFSAFALI